jgi:excisionase family DNA binding protein
VNQTELPEDAIDSGTAARLVKVSTNTIRTWTQKGIIRGWMRGNRRIVSRAEVLAQVRPIVPGEGEEEVPRTRQEMERAARAALARIAERRKRPLRTT